MRRRDAKRLSRRLLGPRPPRPKPQPTDPLPRIEALTRNARTTWFALLGVLVFDAITLMGVRDIDFWGVNRATELPLVGVTVPTKLFFYAAPVLTAAVYAYFHLYLIRLIDALYSAEPTPGGQPLGDAVTPWLVSDALLDMRTRIRRDGSTTRRMMELPAALLNLALAWGFGLAVLWWLWLETGPARDLSLTLTAAAMLLLGALAGWGSLMHLFERIRTNAGDPNRWIGRGMITLFPVALGAILLFPSLDRTTGDSEQLASLSLVGEAVVERPPNWLRRDHARREFRADWCRQEGIADCADLNDSEDEFEDEWTERRRADIAALVKPDVNRVRVIDANLAVALRDADNFLVVFEGGGRLQQAFSALAPFRARALNLRNADLRYGFYVGLDLTAADLTGAQLHGARMEEVELFGATLDGANLAGAFLQKADLSWASLTQQVNLTDARLEGAFMMGTQLVGAFAVDARMENAALFWAELSDADLRGSSLRGANLSWANLVGTDLSSASLERAVFHEARMEGAVLIGARMEGADLRKARMEGADLSRARLEGADLRAAQMEGANLRLARMEGAHLSESRMEGADLSFSLLTGSQEKPTLLRYTDLSASTNDGGALRFVDLSPASFDGHTDWRNAFLDGSVAFTKEFRGNAGDPCQWTEETLSDEAFYGRWRWWYDAQPGIALPWEFFAPEPWRDVPVNPGPEGCTWKTGPMNGPR